MVVMAIYYTLDLETIKDLHLQYIILYKYLIFMHLIFFIILIFIR